MWKFNFFIQYFQFPLKKIIDRILIFSSFDLRDCKLNFWWNFSNFSTINFPTKITKIHSFSIAPFSADQKRQKLLLSFNFLNNQHGKLFHSKFQIQVFHLFPGLFVCLVLWFVIDMAIEIKNWIGMRSVELQCHYSFFIVCLIAWGSVLKWGSLIVFVSNVFFQRVAKLFNRWNKW